MKKEVKMDDFISDKELNAMSYREKEIYEQVFLIHKQKLQDLTDTLSLLDDINNKIDNK